MTERKWQVLNEDEVKKHLSSDNFLSNETCGCPFPIHTFRIIGDSVQGRLRPCNKRDRNDRARCAHIAFYSANGEEVTIAIRLTGILWKPINEHHLWGRWIRITYIGNERMRFGHCNIMKIYRIEVDKGAITENFETIPTDIEDSKGHKPRKPRPIRRPMANTKKSKRAESLLTKENQARCDTATRVKQEKEKLLSKK
ncbi:MAG: hypothetical protein WAV28_07060 [Sedimentisphaerales bacterium]